MRYKSLLFFLGLIITSNLAYTQGTVNPSPTKIYKSFLDKRGGVTDSVHAASYALFTQAPDSLWVMKMFGMNDTIKYEGVYKDKALSVPHGKFIYYYKLPAILKENRSDTLNYVKTIGYYDNGFKVGRWTYFFYNGNKENIETYLNDDLNGPFMTYNFETNTPFIKGNYINNKKEGEWTPWSATGNKIKTEVYENDNLVKSTLEPTPYMPAIMTDKFRYFLLKNITNIIHPKTGGIIIIRSSIASDGKLFNPIILKGSINPDLDNKILTFISNGPNWKPPYNKQTKTNIQDFVELRIVFQYYTEPHIESLENEMIEYYRLMH